MSRSLTGPAIVRINKENCRKSGEKRAICARHSRVSARSIQRTFYLPFVSAASASCGAMGAETRPCNQRERELTLREKTFPHFTQSSSRFFSSPTSRIPLSARARNAAVSWRVAVSEKGDRKYLLSPRCGRQWRLLCAMRGFFYDIKL